MNEPLEGCGSKRTNTSQKSILKVNFNSIIQFMFSSAVMEKEGFENLYCDQ